MTDEPVSLNKFREALARKRAASAPLAGLSMPDEFDADLIPDFDEDVSTGETRDPDLEEIIQRIGIIDAYRMWCGKSEPSRKDRRTEGIKVSCPRPTHPDRDPSAWLNTELNVWNCGSCEVGGDVYDIAAYHFGFPVPGYKEGATFIELRRKMAESMGYTFVTAPGLDKPIPVPPEEKYVEKPTKEPKEEKKKGSATVTEIFDDGDGEPKIDLPRLDWRPLAASGTFLGTYMDQCILDDVPEEYHFWNALLAIGLAGGRDISLYDQTPVYANLFLCLTGPTGDGKSRSYKHLFHLLNSALPYKYDEPGSKGVDFIKAPASAEQLIFSFSKPVMDETNPKKVAYYAPVRGLIEFNELSSLTGRAGRKGSVLKPTLMEFYDGMPTVETSSRTFGRTRAEEPFGSAFTTTQPKALKSLVQEGDAHSGFLNRWIFASGTPKRRVSIGGAQIDIVPAVMPLREISGWIGLKRQISWSDSAMATFDEFFHDVLHPAQQKDETDLLTRIDLLAKKLVLLLCMNEHLPEVPSAMVHKVASMFSYLTAAYGIPAAHIGSTISTEVQNEIFRHIERYTGKKGGISLRDLNKCIARKKFPLDVVSKSLKYMTELGMIETFTTSGVGRPTVKYRVA